MVARGIGPADRAGGGVQGVEAAVERADEQRAVAGQRGRRRDEPECRAAPLLLPRHVDRSHDEVQRAPEGRAVVGDRRDRPHRVAGADRPSLGAVRVDRVGTAAGVAVVDRAVRADVGAALPPADQLLALGRRQRGTEPPHHPAVRRNRRGRADAVQDLVAAADHQRGTDARLDGEQRRCGVDDPSGRESPPLLARRGVEPVQHPICGPDVDGAVRGHGRGGEDPLAGDERPGGGAGVLGATARSRRCCGCRGASSARARWGRPRSLRRPAA